MHPHFIVSHWLVSDPTSPAKVINSLQSTAITLHLSYSISFLFHLLFRPEESSNQSQVLTLIFLFRDFYSTLRYPMILRISFPVLQFSVKGLNSLSTLNPFLHSVFTSIFPITQFTRCNQRLFTVPPLCFAVSR